MRDAETFEKEFHAAGCCECGRSDLPMEHDGFSRRLLCGACYAKRIDKTNLYFKGVDAGRQYCAEDNHSRLWWLAWIRGFSLGSFFGSITVGVLFAIIRSLMP